MKEATQERGNKSDGLELVLAGVDCLTGVVEAGIVNGALFVFYFCLRHLQPKQCTVDLYRFTMVSRTVA